MHQCHVQYKPKITRKSTANYVNAVFKVPGKPKKKKRAPATKAPGKKAPAKKRKATAVDEDAKPAAKKKKAKAVEEDAKPAAKKRKATKPKTAKKQSTK